MQIAEAIEEQRQAPRRGRRHRGHALLHDDARGGEAELRGRDLVHAGGLPRAAPDARGVPVPAQEPREAERPRRHRLARRRACQSRGPGSGRAGAIAAHSASRSSRVSMSVERLELRHARPRASARSRVAGSTARRAPGDALEQARARGAPARAGSSRRRGRGPRHTSWSVEAPARAEHVCARDPRHVGADDGHAAGPAAERLVERSGHPRPQVAPRLRPELLPREPGRHGLPGLRGREAEQAGVLPGSGRGEPDLLLREQAIQTRGRVGSEGEDEAGLGGPGPGLLEEHQEQVEHRTVVGAEPTGSRRP